MKKLPKWIWDELEGHDILSVKEDGKLPIRIILESKLEELLKGASEPAYTLTEKGWAVTSELEHIKIADKIE